LVAKISNTRVEGQTIGHAIRLTSRYGSMASIN